MGTACLRACGFVYVHVCEYMRVCLPTGKHP